VCRRGREVRDGIVFRDLGSTRLERGREILFVFCLFGDDGFELDSRKGPIIGERAPVTCYERLKSSSSFRVKFCFLRRGFVHSGCVCWTERGRETQAHFCVTCLGRRGEVWSIPDVDAGWPERQIFVCGDDCCVLDGNKEQWCESSGVAVIVRAGWFSEL
jgi:hypothetical protein